MFHHSSFYFRVDIISPLNVVVEWAAKVYTVIAIFMSRGCNKYINLTARDSN